MSIQIRGCENSCAQCQKIYIPLHKEYPCPACGVVNKIIEAEDKYDEEHIHLDFINELIGSMKYYKANNGQFVPLHPVLLLQSVHHVDRWLKTILLP